jgi:HEAT repeat protein
VVPAERAPRRWGSGLTDAPPPPPPSLLPSPIDAPAYLARRLRAGVRAEEFAAVGEALGVPLEQGELACARALVAALTDQRLQALRLLAASTEAGSGRADESRVVEGRASFLMRLTKGGDQAGVDLERLDDLRTLLAVVRAGNLRQRRGAVLRIGELLGGDKRVPADQARKAIDVLLQLPSLPLAYELWQVCSRLPGADGRRARAAGEQWAALAARFDASVRAFWDGAASEEPADALEDEELVQLLTRARDLSDEAVFHLAAVITGCDGVSSRRARAALLGALLNAGDPRLLPALRGLIESGEAELLIPAVRALGRIEDPRVHGILKTAYEHTAAAEERLVLAGALGAAGDARGQPYVREVLSTRDERLLPYALEALCELGDRDDVQALTELLDDGNPALTRAALQALGRIGDSRALMPLSALPRDSISSALRAEIEEADEAIHARMELLGEEPPARALAARTFDTAKRAALVRRKDPAVVLLRARLSQVLGELWLALGAHRRAVARLETAAALRPDWHAPVLSLAMSHARRKENAQALAAFRRVLGIDRNAVEDNPAAVRMLAHAFLRRAQAVEQEGRDDIARGLLEEALGLDLRKAPSDLRFAIEQRLHALRIKAG